MTALNFSYAERTRRKAHYPVNSFFDMRSMKKFIYLKNLKSFCGKKDAFDCKTFFNSKKLFSQCNFTIFAKLRFYLGLNMSLLEFFAVKY